jgi:GcrA cell cycle regulator
VVIAPAKPMPPISLAAVVTQVTVAPPPAPPPRPVVVAAPRLAPVQSRPYARIVTCCWPIGEPGTRSFHFCDAPSEPGRPYCTEHAKLAYVKVKDRREDAA